MLIDLSQAVGSYLHEVFIGNLDWGILIGYVAQTLFAMRFVVQKGGLSGGSGGGETASSFGTSVSPVSAAGETSSASRSMTGLLASEPCDSFSILVIATDSLCAILPEKFRPGQ